MISHIVRSTVLLCAALCFSAPHDSDPHYPPLYIAATSDTLDIWIANQNAGTLYHSLSFRSDTFFVYDSTTLNLAANTVTMREERTYDKTGSLLQATQKLCSTAGINTWVIQVQPDGRYTLSSQTGGSRQEKKGLLLNDNIRTTCSIMHRIQKKTITRGTCWQDTSFDPMTAQTIISAIRCTQTPDSATANYTFVNRDNATASDQQWIVSPQGHTLLQELGSAMVARARPPHQQLIPSQQPAVDLTAIYKIPLSQPLKNTDTIDIRFKESGLTMDGSIKPLYDSLPGGWRLKFQAAAELANTIALDLPQTKGLLASASIQSDDQRIIDLAHRLISTETDGRTIVKQLSTYVYKNIKKQNTATFSSALETMQNGYGDCGEHAVLLCALLRAVQIPAWVVMGLVYVPGERAFMYHAWVCTYVSGWLFTDPARGVHPATTDRIPLMIDDSGANILAMARMIGKLSVTISPVHK